MPGRILIVTDVQGGFTRLGNLASPECEKAIPRIREVADDFAGRGDPIVFTKDTHVPNDAEFAVFPEHCLRGTPEHDLVEELRDLEPGALAVIHKTRYSAFFRTPLERVLEQIGPEEVHLVGFCTDICVLHTTADLRNRNHRVVVHRDAVETFDSPGHDHQDVNRWALSHAENVLGASVV